MSCFSVISFVMLCLETKGVDEMEAIRKAVALRLPALPRIRRTPLMESALAFAALGGGGYLALRIMGLLFRLCGVE